MVFFDLSTFASCVEEAHHVRGRVAARGEDLRAADVRLRLELAAELQEQRVQADAADGVQDLRGVVADLAAEETAEDLQAGLGGVGLRGLVRSVTERGVRDLVREHARDLTFVPRVLDDAAVEIDVAARQRERVDVRCVHDAEAVLELRTARVRRELLADAVDVLLDLARRAGSEAAAPPPPPTARRSRRPAAG